MILEKRTEAIKVLTELLIPISCFGSDVDGMLILSNGTFGSTPTSAREIFDYYLTKTFSETLSLVSTE
jgi:hypothetical protein